MATAKIFAYKGNLGIEIDMENGKFINDPKAGGQLGCVIRTDEVEISKEAKDLINACGRDRGSFAQLMLTKHEGIGLENGPSSIGVFGFGKVHLGTNFQIGRMCTKSVLEDCKEVPNVVPEDYKEFIDSLN